MPKVRVLRGVVAQGTSREPGDVLDVTEHEARLLVEVYKDAERLPEAFGGERIAVPEVEHRDPFPRGKRR